MYDVDAQRLRFVYNTYRFTSLDEMRGFRPELLINAVTVKYTIEAFEKVEIPMGTTLREVVEDIGGGVPGGKGLDLNRDYFPMYGRETRGSYRAFRAFMPCLVIDAHELRTRKLSRVMRYEDIQLSGGCAPNGDPERVDNNLNLMFAATDEILALTEKALVNTDLVSAANVEPLEQIIDVLKENMRTNHILRLQKGDCTMETGFVWSDILTNLERTSDHCSNIAGCVMDSKEQNMNLHESLKHLRSDSAFYREKYTEYTKKYLSFV